MFFRHPELARICMEKIVKIYGVPIYPIYPADSAMFPRLPGTSRQQLEDIVFSQKV